jgi:hypothetical protein
MFLGHNLKTTTWSPIHQTDETQDDQEEVMRT